MLEKQWEEHAEDEQEEKGGEKMDMDKCVKFYGYRNAIWLVKCQSCILLLSVCAQIPNALRGL